MNKGTILDIQAELYMDILHIESMTPKEPRTDFHKGMIHGITLTVFQLTKKSLTTPLNSQWWAAIDRDTTRRHLAREQLKQQLKQQVKA